MEQDYKQLFVGGDLSGIQKFLYNISSKKAAVSLKGRSYYLQQYMLNVCSKVVEAVKTVGAEETEVIYNSGGKFYILTQNSDAIRQAIDSCTKIAQKELWQEHMGQLGICISYVPFDEHPDGSVDAGGQKNLTPGILWKTANAQFHRQKSQKYQDVLLSEYDSFFNPIAVGGQTKVCAVTGIESTDCVKIEDDLYVLPSVKQQIQLGEVLRNQEHFKPIEKYVDNTKLGILRMDVDGLGKRFVVGFKSIQEYKAFSKRLVDFFEKETMMIQKEDEFFEYVNIIYAGGDDLFVVGRWDKVVDFAERIHKEVDSRFSKDGITISGGMSIVNPKFPISKAAELAGNAEDSAKRYHSDKYGDKNAFCIFGKTVSWNEELDMIKYYRDRFITLIEKYNLSKSILHKIMLYSSIADQNVVRRKEGKTEDFSYIWHVSYYLTRYMNKYKSKDGNNDEVCSFCRQLRDKDIDYKNGRKLEQIALAARWAELLLKDNDNRITK